MTTMPQFARKHHAPEPIEIRRANLRASLREMNLPEDVIEDLVQTCREDRWSEEIDGVSYTCRLINGRVVRKRSYSIEEFEKEMMDFAAELDQATYERLSHS